MDWLNRLTKHLESNNLAIFRFTDDEWMRLKNSRLGISKFTVARSHAVLSGFSMPAVGLLQGKELDGEPETYFGLVKSRQAISTLQSRVRIDLALPISLSPQHELLHMVTKRGLKTKFRNSLRLRDSVISVKPVLGVHLVERLATNHDNHWAMGRVATALDSSRTYSGNRDLQQDALNLTLKAFGLSSSATAVNVELRSDFQETAIFGFDTEAHVPIFEDDVLDYDKTHVPGFDYVGRDLTGRAFFERGEDTLEIITANRKPLEKAFGVDLIYLNAVKKNIVMVQYKMLKHHANGGSTDWIYRPDQQFEEELNRMKAFGETHAPGPLEYRINPQVFYLRFVRRDAKLGKVTATMPTDHFEVLRDIPECLGPMSGFRISYDTLDGRYLRQEAFVDLLRSGYIGAHAQTTADLETLIREILNGNKALVAALHSTRSSSN